MALNSDKRILVVDDEPYNLALLEAMLESLGYAAELAADGIQALERLGPHIDLALLDVMMPGIDGFEVARKIRNNPVCGHIPIIMVTALNSREDRLKAVEVGVNDFISKPIDQVELRVRMASLLKFKEAQDMVLRHQAELESTVEKRTRALRESEERLRAIFETAQDGIFVKDRYLRYTHINPAMLRFVGKSAEEVMGNTDEDILGPQMAHTIRDVERRVLGGQTIETEHTIRSNQEPVTLACVRVPLMDQNGSVTGICGIARDITERKELFLDPAPKPDEFPSAVMRQTLERVRLAAQTDSLILFLGESGVGKDYMARYLHDHSRRASGPFFSINCAALAPELAESELFGHEAGAFTGSRGRKRGLLELAEGGTLLLNEIGELSPRLQAKLLTFLDSQSLTRVGGEKNITVNARLVAATNRDLEEEVEKGHFRKDLYYRLNVFSIKVPPLRERSEDLPLLVQDLLTNLVTKMGKPRTSCVTPEAMWVLRDYTWPGNVRELRNALERALILAGGSSINPEHLGMHSGTLEPVDPQEEDAFVIRMSAIESMTEVLEEAKRWLVSRGLVISGGSVKEAASRLGITRDQMKYLMKSLGVRR